MGGAKTTIPEVWSEASVEALETLYKCKRFCFYLSSAADITKIRELVRRLVLSLTHSKPSSRHFLRKVLATQQMMPTQLQRRLRSSSRKLEGAHTSTKRI